MESEAVDMNIPLWRRTVQSGFRRSGILAVGIGFAWLQRTYVGLPAVDRDLCD